MKQRRKGTYLFQHAGEGQLEREAPLAARMRPYVPPLFEKGGRGDYFHHQSIAGVSGMITSPTSG
jgi:hypothetical protein